MKTLRESDERTAIINPLFGRFWGRSNVGSNPTVTLEVLVWQPESVNATADGTATMTREQAGGAREQGVHSVIVKAAQHVKKIASVLPVDREADRRAADWYNQRQRAKAAPRRLEISSKP